MDALHRVAHDDEQTRPLPLWERPERSHDSCVNTLLVGLSQTHNQKTTMLLIAVFRKTFVRRNERPLFGLGQGPKLVVEHPLAFGAPDIKNVVSHRPEFLNGNVRDVLVDQNLHEVRTTSSSRLN